MIATISGPNLSPEPDKDLWIAWLATLTTYEAKTYKILAREARESDSVNLRDIAQEVGVSKNRLLSDILPNLERYGFIALSMDE